MYALVSAANREIPPSPLGLCCPPITYIVAVYAHIGGPSENERPIRCIWHSHLCRYLLPFINSCEDCGNVIQRFTVARERVAYSFRIAEEGKKIAEALAEKAEKLVMN